MKISNYQFVTLTLTFTMFVTFANAQIRGTLNYKLTINDNEFPPNTVNYIIYLDNYKSIEIATSSDIKTKNIDEKTSIVVTNEREDFILKDFKSKKLILADYLGVKTRLISDTLLNFNWTITKDKKRISNFNCTRATTKFRGRSYIAWFTEDVPIQNGPWKFCGLPGLIVKVADDKLIFNYELTGINLKAKFNANIISIPHDYAKDKVISYKDFIARYYKIVLNNKKIGKVVETGNDGVGSSGEIILPVKMEKF